jgi:hypothetical protein
MIPHFRRIEHGSIFYHEVHEEHEGRQAIMLSSSFFVAFVFFVVKHQDDLSRAVGQDRATRLQYPR